MTWACDRIARSTRHFLEVLDELSRINFEFVSFRERIDNAGPLGRTIVVIVGCIAGLERSPIVERVRASPAQPAPCANTALISTIAS
jgi:DNA invertase Pin-like site-specific DNA recombinase